MSGATWVAIEMASVQAMSLLTFAAMARFLSATDFGLISICFATIQILKSLLIDNVAAAVTRKPDAATVEYDTVFWITLLVSGTTFAALVTAATLLQKGFDAPGLGRIVREMSVIILVMGLARTHECWMIRHFHFRTLALRNMAAAFVSGIVGVALAANGVGLLSLVVQQVLANVLAATALWLWCPWRPAFRVSRPCFREVVRFLAATIPGSFASIASQTMDTFAITYFSGVPAAGLYSMAKRLRFALQMVFSTPVSAVAMPSLAEARRNPDAERTTILTTFFILSSICAPAFIGASCVSADAIGVVFGSRWISAAPIFSLLSLCGLAYVIQGYCDTIFFVLGRPMMSFRITTTYILLVAVCLFTTRATVSDANVAIPFTVPFAFTVPASLYLVARISHLDNTSLWRAILPAIAASAVMALGLRLLACTLPSDQPLLRLAVMCAVGMTIYAGAIYAVAGETLRPTLLGALGRLPLPRSSHRSNLA